MNAILRVFDILIPPQLRNSPSDLMRCYVFIGVILTNFVFAITSLVGLLWILDIPEDVRSLAVVIDAMTAVCNVITLIVFRITRNFPIASNLMILFLCLIIVPSTLISGGYQDSPIVQLMMLIPVTGFLLTGLRTGLFWLVMTMLICIGLAIADAYDYMDMQLIRSAELREMMAIGIQVTMLGMVGGALITYELINENLKSILNEERNKFEHRASHDALTSIPNRFEFFRRLNAAVVECANRQQKCAVVYIDLDGFKPVNDKHGHHAGDELLKVISVRLEKVLRASDTVARLGGDEFALILPGINVPADIDLVVGKVLETIKKPIPFEGKDLQVKGSAGVSVYPDHSENTDELCKQADAAMYKAKEKHDTYVYFSKELENKV